MSKDDWAEKRRQIIRAAVTPRGSGGPSALERVRQRYEGPSESAIDWDMWGSMASVELWQALVLSVACNPAFPPPSGGAGEPNEEYRKRLQVAESHLGPGGTLPVVSGGGGRGQPRVRLPDFARWADSLKWKLPGDFNAWLETTGKAETSQLRASVGYGFPRAEGTPVPTAATERHAAPPPGRHLALDAEDVAPEHLPPHSDAAARMRIQAEASEEWIRWLARGAQPAVHSISDVLAKWCADNDVRTKGGVNPRAGTIRNTILGGKNWTPPKMSREDAKAHVARVAQVARR